MKRAHHPQALAALLLVVLSLLGLAASAASLKPDRTEMAVGEITTVYLKGAPFIAVVDWKVGPELEILDSDRKHVRIRARKGGTATVTCEMNLKTYTTTLAIRETAAAAPSPAPTPHGPLLSAPMPASTAPPTADAPRGHDSSERFGDTGAPPPSAPSALAARITEFAWRGMDEDRVGDWGNGRPNGARDGHFRLILDAPGRFAISSLSLWSANEKGEKLGGQAWHSQSGSYWMLGVFRDDRQLNASHAASLGDFEGRIALDLYANDSGWFNPGQWFLLEMQTADGKLARQALRIAAPGMGQGGIAPPPGGRDYSYRDTYPAAGLAPPGGSDKNPENPGRELEDALQELRNLYKR